MDLETMLEKEEGRRNLVYADPVSHGEPYTVGVGHTGPDVKPGETWTDERIDTAFEADRNRAVQFCQDHFSWYPALNDPRRAVIAGMAFEMGGTGLLGFHHTLGCVAAGDWAGAYHGMLASDWHKQVPGRAQRMAAQMLTGLWYQDINSTT